MPTWLILLQACWIVGAIALIAWGCVLCAEMYANLLPGVSRWKVFLLRRMPAPEQLNEKGQSARRRNIRLGWIAVAYFLGEVVLMQFAKFPTDDTPFHHQDRPRRSPRPSQG